MVSRAEYQYIQCIGGRLANITELTAGIFAETTRDDEATLPTSDNDVIISTGELTDANLARTKTLENARQAVSDVRQSDEGPDQQ